MILIGVGSNMGDRQQNIITAITELAKHTEIQIDKISSLYETKPVGVTDQPNFLNGAISINTTLTPHQLISWCLQVECQMGRIRDQRWGPRNIDIDILTYHGQLVQDEILTLPHPRLQERCFVLIPLQEIAASEKIYQGFTPGELLQKRDDIGDVILHSKVNIENL